jgi:dolichyl-phosphate beta-glucosyltransferase
MTGSVRLSYVVPVHNQEAVLPDTVPRLVARLRDHPGSEVLLVENGSTDGSMAVCVGLASTLDSPGVRVQAANSARGLGHALRRGMEIAHGDLIVLTAADLPFGFSDLDAYLATRPAPMLAIGSKAHPQSHVTTSRLRKVMSDMFRVLRLLILGLRVRDSQGTILIQSPLARRILPYLRCGGFLISTEVVYVAQRAGTVAVELPITYTAGRTSTVSPLRDSTRMALGLLSLRRRLRHIDIAAGEARAS